MTAEMVAPSSMELSNHKKSSVLFSTFDDIFEHFIDTDSYGLSDNTADRSVSDEWGENYFDVPDSTSECDAIANSPRISHEAFDLRAPWDCNFDNLDDYLALGKVESHSKPSSPIPNSRSSIRKHRKSSSLDALCYRSLSGHDGLCISPRMSYPDLGTQQRSRNARDGKADKSATSAQATQYSMPSQTLSVSPLPLSAPLPQSQWIDGNPYSDNSYHAEASSFDPVQSSFPRTMAFERTHHTNHLGYAPIQCSNTSQDEAMAQEGCLDPQASYYNDTFLPASSSAHETQYGQGYEPIEQMVSFRGRATALDQPYTYPSSADRHENAELLAHSQPHRAGRPEYPANEELYAVCSDRPVLSIESAAGSSSGSSMHATMQQRQQHARASSRPLPHHRLSEHSTSVQQPNLQDFSQQMAVAHMYDDSSATVSPRPAHRQQQQQQQQQQPSPPRSRKGSRGPNAHHRRSKTVSGIAERKPCKDSTIKSLGFVHFTPDDSRKILSGVAPSGSSKTKARREREATEKRRRLGQVAAKAVLEAGGDLDELRRAMSQET